MVIRRETSAVKKKGICPSLLQAIGVVSISLIVALVLLILPTMARAKNKKDTSADARQKALQLFQKALAISDIRAKDSQPFALTGIIEIPSGHGKSATGNYSLLWAGPDRWREEIRFVNYSRVRVGGKDRYWQVRSTDFEPLPFLSLEGALDYIGHLRHWAEPDSISGLQELKFKDKKIAGAKTECAVLTEEHEIRVSRGVAKFKTTTTYCFNPSNGGLASTSASASPPETIEYSDFVPFAGKAVPSTIVVAEDRAPIVQFHISQISPLGNEDPKMFVPPSSAEEWDSCDTANLKKAEIIRQQVPIYPQVARTSHIAGSVSVYAVIGADGLLHNMKVLVSPSVLLSQSAVDALQGWHYQPATCNGKPLANETVLTIVYALGN